MKPRKHQKSNQMFHYFNIENLVPQNHILRQINKVIDFGFIYDQVKDTYCPDNGRPGVDPELLFRMLLIGYLYDLSERKLFEEVKMHAAYRWFCGLSFDDEVPDRSTMNKLLNHKWESLNVTETILNRIIQRCIDEGLVSGKHVSVDGTQIRANASVKSLEPFEIHGTVTEYLHTLIPDKKPMDDTNKPTHPQDRDFHGTKLSNATHRSTTDPDARLYRKSNGKEALLSYIGNNLIDTKSRVILATKATHASREKEIEAAREMLDKVTFFLDSQHALQTLAADTGYGESTFIADVLDKGITPHIPLLASPHIEPIPQWKRKTYKPHILEKRKQKIRLTHARNTVRMNTKTSEYHLSQKLRKRSEHLFAEGKQWHGLDRARCRGLHKLDRQLMLTASVQNLKRLVSYINRKKRNASVVSIRQVYSPISSLFNVLSHCIKYITEIIQPNSWNCIVWV
jgi:transposase